MTIVVIEDQKLTRDVLVKACRDAGHEVTESAADGRAGIDAALRRRPDLLVLDLELPLADGFAVIEAVRKEHPRVRILILSAHCDEVTVAKIDAAQVDGFLDKDSAGIDSIGSTLESIEAGRPFFSAHYRNARARLRRDPASWSKILGAQEYRVLAMIGDLMTDPEIAAELGISKRTAEHHRFNIMGKLGIQDRAHLLRYAREHGFTRSIARRPTGQDSQ